MVGGCRSDVEGGSMDRGWGNNWVVAGFLMYGGLETVAVVGVVDGPGASVGFAYGVEAADVVTVAGFGLGLGVSGVWIVDAVFEFVGGVRVRVRFVAVTRGGGHRSVAVSQGGCSSVAVSSGSVTSTG